MVITQALVALKEVICRNYGTWGILYTSVIFSTLMSLDSKLGLGMDVV